MESDDDYRSFSPQPESPVQHRRLKRLKKTRVPKKSPVKSVDDLLSLPRVDFAELEALESSKIRGFEDSSEPFLSQSPSEGFDDDKELSSGVDDKKLSSGFDDQELSAGFDELRVHEEIKETERALEFDDVANEFDEKGSSGFDDLSVHNERKETMRFFEFDDIADELDGKGDNQMCREEEETVDLNREKNEKKRANEDVSNEKKDNKKRVKSSGDDMKPKASSSNKRREEKERRAHLQQLHAESQRLLRETRSAAFKPVPLVQKPISSVLEKIRQRKLEVSRKFSPSNSIDLIGESNNDFTEVVIKHSEKVYSVEGSVEKLVNLVEEEKVAKDVEPKSDASQMGGSNLSGEQLSSDNVPSQMVLEEESTPPFRAPLDDTQDLFGDSQTSDSKDELPCDQNNNPQEEVLAPSFLTMQLKFDSAPPDDISSDEEENDKENVDPHPCKLDEGCSSPKGDPVKAFVDDEAEEEDDSDNDRSRFQEDEEDEDSGDLEEFKDMIVTGYKEKPIDNEIRNELHQKWLEEKDASGTDDLLRRLKYGSELREAGLLDEEEDDEEDEESGSEAEEDVVRTNVARISTRKAKQMIVQMFSDKDEAFLSSDDEETEKKLVRERLLNKVEEQSKLLSPAEDESSREVFGLIKKLNIVSEPKKKAKSSSFSDSMLTGGNSNSSSKSSFLSRVSNHSVPTSRKQGTSMVKSFIFGRDDSNSRSSISMSEDSSDTVSKESQPARKVTAKFCSSQTRSSTQTARSATEAASGTSLFEILKRSSVQSTKVCNQDNIVGLSQNVFAAFKIPKQPIKPVKIEGRT